MGGVLPKLKYNYQLKGATKTETCEVNFTINYYEANPLLSTHGLIEFDKRGKY